MQELRAEEISKVSGGDWTDAAISILTCTDAKYVLGVAAAPFLAGYYANKSNC